MQMEVDEFGKPLFQAEEFLDATQVKNLYYKFTHIKKKESYDEKWQMMCLGWVRAIAKTPGPGRDRVDH